MSKNCPKQVKEVSPNIETNDGFFEFTRKEGKGKNIAKHNLHISGIRLTKPQPKYFYRVKPKTVANDASTSAVNNGKSCWSMLVS